MENLPAVPILLQNVTVEYRSPLDRVLTLKEYMIRLIQGRVAYRKFLALKNIDLQVPRGEVLGIIGHNGAGKSTLLKVISRVLIPSSGRVVIRGTAAPLLELGAGFHPELSGRENIYLNGSLLGLSKEQIADREPSIIEFAELKDFIDAPLRTYSSGMQARLGFAVATSVDPDLLIIDEILSVGDEAFQHKSEKRMSRFFEHGIPIVYVSHDLASVARLCTRVIQLEQGTIKRVGTPAEVIAAYREENL